MLKQYKATPDGLCGNDDCSQMSAWYVFGALGYYPVNPSDGIYVIGSPLVNGAAISVGNGKQFEIKSKNQSAENCFVQSVKLNGKPYLKTWINPMSI